MLYEKHLDEQTKREILIDNILVEPASVESVSKYLADPSAVQITRIDWNANEIDSKEEDYPTSPIYASSADRPFSLLSNQSTTESPRVIYDDSASFCDVMLFISEKGEAIHFHHGFSEMNKESVGRILNDLKVKVKQRFPRSRLFLSGSLNSASLITEVYADELEIVNANSVLSSNRGERGIGMIFIPHEVATDNKIHILIPTILVRTKLRELFRISEDPTHIAQ